MQKFMQHSSETEVSCRHRMSVPRAAVELPLNDEQAMTLASWDMSPPSQKPPSARTTRKFQQVLIP
jgi:hypothetical protein